MKWLALLMRWVPGLPGGRPGSASESAGMEETAASAGFRTVAIARGKDKETLALELGARHHIDSQAQDPAAELRSLGGARVILATVTNGDAMAAVVGGLGTNGTLMVIGAPPSLT